MTVAMKLNEELNGIELYFNSKPATEVLSNLKSNGFRWSKFKKCWYTKQSENAFQVATALTTGLETLEVIKETPVKKAAKKSVNLWEATRWTDMDVNKKQDTKAIAKEVRAHLKQRFANCKFSVTSTYNTVNISIKSTPYEVKSTYTSYIREYCQSLLNAYNYCTSYDPYGDYGSSYSFYDSVNIHWDYTQTEATEEIKLDMINFDNKLNEFNKQEEERKHAEFKAWQAEQEQQKAAYEQREQEEKKEIENIYNSINVNELDENEQYFIKGSEFANLNKNATLDQYKEEVSKGDYILNNVQITKEIHFTNEAALTSFSNMLLNDFDFLTGTGGSFTNDNRINSMTDYYEMDEFERQTVEWALSGVAIYFNGKLQFIVDAQGHSYARYVGLIDNAKVEKTLDFKQAITEEEVTELKFQADQLEDISVSVIEELNIFNTWNKEDWKLYRNAITDKLKGCNFKPTKEIIQQLEIEELKASMYKLIKETDGIQNQFENADIKQGEKVTLFYISDIGGIVTNRITFDSVTNTRYAQYENAVKLTYTPENKRKQYYQHFHSTLLVFKGWQSLPENVLYNVEEKKGFRVTSSKFHSCDKQQYDEILNYFDQNGIRPIVNTHKPQF